MVEQLCIKFGDRSCTGFLDLVRKNRHTHRQTQVRTLPPQLPLVWVITNKHTVVKTVPPAQTVAKVTKCSDIGATDPAEKMSIDGVRSPFFTSLVVRSRLFMSFVGSTVLHELSTNLSGAM